MRIVALIAFCAAFGSANADAGFRVVIDDDGVLRTVASSDAVSVQPASPADAQSTKSGTSSTRNPARPSAAENSATSTHAPKQQENAGQFDEMLGASLQTNAGLKASGARGKAANAAVWREWSALLPAIEAGGGLSDDKSSGTYSDGTLSVSMMLFDPAAFNRARSAKSQALSVHSEALVARDRLLISTAASWLRGIYALSAAKEYRSAVARLEKLRRSVVARKASGFASAAEVNAVDVRIASLRRELASFDEIAAKSRAEIESATGGHVKLTTDLPNDAALAGFTEDELSAMIVARSPTLQSALFASDAALFSSDAAKSEYLPKVRVSADYNAVGLGGYGTRQNDLTVGVRLSVPVFQGGYIASVAERSELAQASKWEAQDVQRRVQLQVETLFREREAAAEKRKQVNAESGELESLVKSLDAQYREGFGSIDELLNQQVSLARTKEQAVEVRTQQLYTAFQLIVLAGLADNVQQ